jgi:hypothetical protein
LDRWHDFKQAPKESHVLAVKRIFRYLKGTKEFGLWYPKGKDLSLIAYTDADWAGCIDDDEAPVEKRSTWVSV